MNEQAELPARKTAWNKISEFTIAILPGCEQTVIVNVGDALAAFNLPSLVLQQLQTAIINTVTRPQPDLFVLVRIFISVDASSPMGKGAAGADDSHAVVTCQPIGKGWGFFMIERRLEEAGREPVAQQNLELFCYQEGP
jgi:hypothetical protein